MPVQNRLERFNSVKHFQQVLSLGARLVAHPWNEALKGAPGLQ